MDEKTTPTPFELAKLTKEPVPTPFELAKLCCSWGWRTTPASIFYNKDPEPTLVKCGPKGWPSKATSNWDKFQDWWEDLPGYQRQYIGVVSGPNSCLVIDCDGPDAVNRFFQITQGEIPKGCLAYRTPGKGGGAHFIFNWNPAISVKHITTKDGIELRGAATPGILTILLGGPPRPDVAPGQDYELMHLPETPEQAPLHLIQAILEEEKRVSIPGNGGGDLLEVNPVTALEMIESCDIDDGRKLLVDGCMWYQAIRGLPMEPAREVAQRLGPAYEARYEKNLDRTLEKAIRQRSTNPISDSDMELYLSLFRK